MLTNLRMELMGSRDQLCTNHSSPDGPVPLVGGGIAEAGAVLQEVDEDAHGAVQGGQEVGGVRHILCNNNSTYFSTL